MRSRLQIANERCCPGFACFGPNSGPPPMPRRAVSAPEVEASRKIPAPFESLPAWQSLRAPQHSSWQRPDRGPAQVAEPLALPQVAVPWALPQVAEPLASAQAPKPSLEYRKSAGRRVSLPGRQAVVPPPHGKSSPPLGQGATTPSFRPQERRATYAARRRWFAWQSCFAKSLQPSAPMLPPIPGYRRFAVPRLSPDYRSRDVATTMPRRLSDGRSSHAKGRFPPAGPINVNQV